MKGPRTGSTVSRVEREGQAVALRRAGRTYDQIAAAMALSNRSVAYKLVQSGLRRWAQPATEELRALELDRADALIARLWPRVDKPLPDLKALDRLLKVLDYRAKLTGLYAPQKQIVGVEVHAQVDVRKLEALELLVRDAEALTAAPVPAEPVGDPNGIGGPDDE